MKRLYPWILMLVLVVFVVGCSAPATPQVQETKPPQPATEPAASVPTQPAASESTQPAVSEPTQPAVVEEEIVVPSREDGYAGPALIERPHNHPCVTRYFLPGTRGIVAGHSKAIY